jgi:hypothetical protein
MKKIYSIVLMAVALLIGTNVWAANVVGNDRAALQAAIDDAASGTTLTLQNDFTLDGPVWLGTEELNGAYKTIILDMNGHKISMATGGANAYMFVLTHGELLVRNSSSTLSLIELTGSTGSNNNTQVFSVFGSYRSSRWNEAGNSTEGITPINTRDQGWFSHLEIGQNVKIVTASGVLGSGIAIDELFATEGAIAKVKALGHTINYTTNIFSTSSAAKSKGNRGLAQGVKVDVYGDIEIPGKGESGAHKAYCIKVNGMVDQPHSNNLVNKEGDPFSGVTYVQNYVPANHVGDTIDVPFIHVHSSAKMVSDNKSYRSTAVYSSGYSKMLIEGYCEGSVGVYANSGKVEINDAEVVSTSPTYTTPTSDGGAYGAGSAVVVNSRDNYTGSVEITISGDSKVTSSTGYAIEEIVTTAADTTKVENVTIEGGTIEGGNKGAIIVSNATATATGAEVVVYGANLTGNNNVQVGTSGDITDILPTDQQGDATAHVTVITDPDTGKKTVVVSDGAQQPETETQWDDVVASADSADVNWTGTAAGIFGDDLGTATKKVLGELQMISGTSAAGQSLTIKKNAELRVEHLLMNKYAQIVVEAGAKFIIYGEQGIVAPVKENIILKHNSTTDEFAAFLFNPEVSSNRHPNATVEFTTKSWRKNSTELQWEWFGIPSYNKATSITSTGDAFVAVYENGGWTNLGLIGGVNNDNPAVLAKLNQPFAAYDLLANRLPSAAAPTITIAGELVGNDNGALNANMKWNPYANSYTAEIDAEALVNALKGSSNIADAIYVAKQNANGTITWNVKAGGLEAGLKLQPMQAFMLLNNKNVEAAAIDYASMVYGPATAAAPAAGAPRRRVANYSAMVTINVANEEGTWDDVDLRENEEAKSYEKYLNDDINIYVVADEKNDFIAAEDLAGTYVGFSTVNGGNFTINFANVEGREFDMIDMETGAKVAVMEGATYEFTAAANTVADYRFKLVERNNAPTAIDNTEAVKSAKGIYTITGQYLGEMNVWNTLPAGVYVINGEKRVK